MTAHFKHLSHSVVSHWHVTWNELSYFFRPCTGADADHVRNVMFHTAHDMMRFVAMKGPVARVVCNKFDIVGIPNDDIKSGCSILRCLRQFPSTDRCDSECI